MAIAFDSSVDGGRGNGVSHSYDFDNSAGDCVVVNVHSQTGRTVTGITYNTVPMAKAAENDAAGVYNTIFVLADNPATGTNEVVITMSASSTFIDSQAASYTGTDQDDPIKASDTSTDPSTDDFTETFTTEEENSWVVWSVDNNDGVATAGTDTTSRESDANGHAIMDSGAARASGSNSVNATTAGSTNWNSVVFELAEAAVTFVPQTNIILT